MLAHVLRRVLACGIGFALAVAVGELFLRQPGGEVQAYYVWWPHLEKRFEPDPSLLPGVHGTGVFRANSLGLRGPELQPFHDLRVVAVGGSTTECLFLDQGDSWPVLLQGHLGEQLPGRRPWVGNAGRSGLNSRDHVVLLEPLLDSVPDVDLVLVLAGVNDLMLRLSQDQAYDPTVLAHPGAPERLLRRNFQLLPPERETRLGWKGRSAVWRLAGRLREDLFPSYKALDDRGESIERWRRHRREATVFRENLPELGPALGEYERNLRRLVRVARSRGVAIVLIDQPHLYADELAPGVEELLLFGGVGDHLSRAGCEYYRPGSLARGMEAYNQVLHRVAREEGVPSLALSGHLSGSLEHFYDDVHFNIEGARAVARFVAEELLARRPWDAD